MSLLWRTLWMSTSAHAWRKMLVNVGWKVWQKSNFIQKLPTWCNTAQHVPTWCLTKTTYCGQQCWMMLSQLCNMLHPFKRSLKLYKGLKLSKQFKSDCLHFSTKPCSFEISKLFIPCQMKGIGEPLTVMALWVGFVFSVLRYWVPTVAAILKQIEGFSQCKITHFAAAPPDLQIDICTNWYCHPI